MSVALRAAVAGVVAAGLACGGGSEPKPPGGDELPDGVVTVAERQGALEALHEELASLDCSARTRSSPRRRSSGPSPGRRCSPTSSGRRSRSIR